MKYLGRSNDNEDLVTKKYVDTKSSVSVSPSGSATDEVQYITIDGVEKKIAGFNMEEALQVETIKIDNSPIEGSNKLITSGGVYNALSAAGSSRAYAVISSEGVSSISIPSALGVHNPDTLAVYQNGVLLVPTVNYTATTTTITLLDYAAHAGDVFIFCSGGIWK